MSLLVEIRPIHSKDIDLYWNDAKPLLQKAIDRADGEYTIEWLYNSLKEVTRNLWVVFKGGVMIAAITTRIDEYPSGIKIGCIDFAGGSDFKDWKMFTDYIENLFFDLGCSKLEIAGRLGWLRLHTDKGFKPIYHVLRKELHGQKQ